jgi:hypothetical protein
MGLGIEREAYWVTGLVCGQAGWAEIITMAGVSPKAALRS